MVTNPYKRASIEETLGAFGKPVPTIHIKFCSLYYCDLDCLYLRFDQSLGGIHIRRFGLCTTIVLPTFHQTVLKARRCQEHETIQSEGRMWGQIGKEAEQNNKVQGDAEKIIDARALRLGNNGTLECSHDGEVHANSHFEQVHSQKLHRLSAKEGNDSHGKRCNTKDGNTEHFTFEFVAEDAKDTASGHAANHERGKDLAKGQRFYVCARQGRGPHKNKDLGKQYSRETTSRRGDNRSFLFHFRLGTYIHAPLEKTANGTAQENVFATNHRCVSTAQTFIPFGGIFFVSVLISISIIFLPHHKGCQRGEQRSDQGDIKGAEVSSYVQEFFLNRCHGKRFRGLVGHQARQNGYNGIGKGCPGKRFAEVIFQLGIRMGTDQPGLKNGKQQTGSNSSQETSNHENSKVFKI
eukprot:scaffold2192_cov170-Amphora_coffeaeformis.AAC.27